MQGSRFIGASLGLGLAIVVSQGLVGAGQSQNAPPIPNSPRLPMAPNAPIGNSVTPAQEGWLRNADGTASMLLGYSNRNNAPVTIPVGPNNRIEPYGWSGPKTQDYGQPTYFERGRNYGLFTIVVPKDFGTKRYIWSITINDQVQSILLNASNESYVLAPYFRHDNGNTPPVVKLEPGGAEFTGPPRGFAATLSTTVGGSLPLNLLIADTGNTIAQGRVGAPAGVPPVPTSTDGAAAAAGGRGGAGRGAGRGGGRGGGGADAAAGAQAAAGAGGAGGRAGGGGGGGGGRGGRGGEAEEGCGGARGGGGRGGGGGGGGVTIKWVKHRGPGDVTFDCSTPAFTADAEVAKLFKGKPTASGKATATAKFSAPGEYTLRAQLSDGSDFRDQCCWTNVHVRVNVK
jgi:hypothetical protein